MDKNSITIRAGSLFPWHFQLIAGALLVMGVAIAVEHTVLSVFLILAGGFMLSGHEGVVIDKGDRTYREYRSFFFIKSGKKITYTGLEKIFINTSKVTQQLYTAHTTHSSIFTNIAYNAYLKLDDGTKIHLLSKRNKKKLVNTLNSMAAFLNIPVHDNTPTP